LIAFSSSAGAQSNVTGSIYGETAAQGQISVHGLSSGVRITVEPDAGGRFRVPALPPGLYRVTYTDGSGASRSEDVSVAVGGATAVSFAPSDGVDLGTITVSGSAIAPVDVQQTESSLDISATELERLPVPRDLQSVALLAPGTIKGDTAFGSQAVSFGGASVAENTYYFNGFNITNFRDGLGFSDVPYEFFDTFQVKTGGYGAEFGRSLGGVVNTTSKHGGDIPSAGINLYWEPQSLRAKSPSLRYDDPDDVDGDGHTQDEIWFNNQEDESDAFEGNVYAGGAIVPGHLYAYGLVSFKNSTDKFAGTAGLPYSYSVDEQNTPFYGAKIDYLINDRNTLEFTYFRNEDDIDRTRVSYDPYTEIKGESLGGLKFERGGNTYIGRYTARLTDRLTLSALAGRSELKDNTIITPTDCNYAVNAESGAYYGCTSSALNDLNDDSRNAYRVDLEYAIARHQLRAGWDYELLKVGNDDYYSGTGNTYRYFPSRNGIGDGYALQTSRYLNVGSVETKTMAFYLEDTWNLTERLSLYAGIRNETFENSGVTGETFFKVDDQWAPRLGLSYDVVGQGRSKLYATWGRYYLPVATNTNIRLGGAELYEYTLYENYTSIAADGTPIGLGDVLASDYFNGSDGNPKDARQLVDQEGIEPMYQDEYSIGFQMAVAPQWNAEIRFMRRELKTSLEDECLDGYVADATCVLVNPGQDVTLYTHYQDTDGDGLYYEDPTDDLHAVTLSNELLGFPKAERKYNAVDVSLERIFDRKWTFKATYTWSQSYGNTEGYVNSDNGQPDPGITIAFDYPGLTENSYGFLPNDRRHKIKMFGAYQFTERFSAGANVQIYSGRPINCFGNYPDRSVENSGDYSWYYGAASFYCGRKAEPRGTAGRTPWSYQLDLSAQFTPYQIPDMRLGVDVFNVLNGDAKTQASEYGEVDGEYLHLPTIGLATEHQTPRYVRFSLSYGF
jgi:hypothetical protein